MMNPLRRAKFYLAKVVLPLSSRLFWELRTDDIYDRWIGDTHDHQLVNSLLDRLKPRTLLDVGCGSGRLLTLFLNHGVEQIVGQDLSRAALRRARQRFPSPALTLVNQKIEELDYPAGHFDLCVCMRVLSAIPTRDISAAIRRLVSVSRHLYFNEYSASDGGEPSSYWFLHDYFELLDRHAKYSVLETGLLGKETYHVIRVDSLRQPLERHRVSNRPRRYFGA